MRPRYARGHLHAALRRLQPALLARGLADAVERRGVRVYEHTEVLDDPRPATAGDRPSVRTSGGTVRADVVVRATEAWTPTLPGLERATSSRCTRSWWPPSPSATTSGSRAGLESRATFADHRHLIIYGQRTADGRIAFGGRGAPYHFGSTVRPAFDAEPAVHALLRQTLAELFPDAGGGPLHPRLGRPARHSARTGTPRSGSTAPPAWPGPAATWATGCRRPTWPAARWPTSSPGRTRR